MIVHPLPRTIVRPPLEQFVPQELETVARLCSSSESGDPAKQLGLLQFDQVFLCLSLPHSNLGAQGLHGRKAAAILAGITSKPTPGKLRTSFYDFGTCQ